MGLSKARWRENTVFVDWVAAGVFSLQPVPGQKIDEIQFFLFLQQRRCVTVDSGSMSILL